MCVNIIDFEQNFRFYWAYIQEGNSIFLMQASKIVAVISPMPQNKATRPCGLAKGTFEVPANFNEPLAPEILNAFYA